MEFIHLKPRSILDTIRIFVFIIFDTFPVVNPKVDTISPFMVYEDINCIYNHVWRDR